MKNFLLGFGIMFLMAVAGRQFNGADEVIFMASTATPGNATLAAPLVRGVIALGASSITVTDSFVTDANAHVECSLEANDTTGLYVRSVVPSASQFILTITANATANLGFSCLVHNAH